jgi:DEAD/DEAH box helicase domain-containing protein
MAKLPCPICRGPLRFAMGKGLGLIAMCARCELGASTEEGDEESAYVALLDAFEAGRAKPGNVRELLQREGLLIPREDVERLVNAQGLSASELPGDVRELVFSDRELLVHYALLRPSEPRPSERMASSLPPDFLQAASRLLPRPYSFQVEAWARILRGANTLIIAPAGSGKTEAFAVPVLYLASRRGARPSCLFIYPTKALGRDQRPRLASICEAFGARVEVMDGDTPEEERRRIAADPPHAIITNLDAIHYHLLYNTPFGRQLRRVRFVVLDEVQSYKGIYGAHAHFVLRRLRRVAGPYQVVAASALLQNPLEFAEKLCGLSFEVVREEAGARGAAHLIALMPVLRSYHDFFVEAAKLLLRHRKNVLLFFNSHRSAEWTALLARRQGLRVEVHRAGLPASHRQRVEDEFRRGELRAVAATPTLELGIDIGSVDAIASELVVVNRLVQRAGRAGRRGQESAVVVVLRPDDPIGEYYRRNFRQFFEDVEAAYLDPHNPFVSEKHVLAMALERPLDPEEAREFERDVQRLAQGGLLRRSGELYVANRRAALRALGSMSLRSIGESVGIYVGGRKRAERELPIALEELHEGAVYLINGWPFISRGLDLRRRRAELEPLRGASYYTRPIVEESPRILEVLGEKRAFGLKVLFAEVELNRAVVAYVKRELGREGGGETIPLPEPASYSFRTKGLVFKAPRPLNFIARWAEDAEGWEGSSYHATEHALIEGTDMITGGAAEEMGGLSLGSSGIILIYDGAPGGNGATYLLYERLQEALRRALEVVSGCPCASLRGCPRCVYSYRCGNDNRFLSREGAEEVLLRIARGEGRDLSVEEVGGRWRG